MSIPFIFGKKKDGAEKPTLTKEQLQTIRDNAAKYIIPAPNNDIEFVRLLFNEQKYYQRIKKMMWKNHK